MCFCFNVTAKHPWNTDLAVQFVEQFMVNRGVKEAEEALIYELFTVHFGSVAVAGAGLFKYIFLMAVYLTK